MSSTLRVCYMQILHHKKNARHLEGKAEQKGETKGERRHLFQFLNEMNATLSYLTSGVHEFFQNSTSDLRIPGVR